ncbi:MAG: alkyl sulfatase dimerization domain-containing protein [Alphaproteobacteria bacterium]
MKKILITSAIIIGLNIYGVSSAENSNFTQPEVLQLNIVPEVEAFADPKILEHLAPIVWQGENLAVTEDSEKVNPRATAFAKQMPKTIYEPVKGKAYLMSGWQLTSTLIVVGDGGLIVVDPGENDDASRQILTDFKEKVGVDLPVKGIVYTHRHVDHAFGSAGLGVTQEMVDKGEVKIFAHHQFMDYLKNDASIVGDILSERTAYGGASYLGQNVDGLIHGGLGPTFSAGEISFIPPTDVVTDTLETEVAGIKMTIFEAYGDAEDEIDIFFPDLKLVHGSETIQGETFPNLYTLRGTKYRDVQQWYKGVDRLINYAAQADAYSHSHMRSWVGNDFIMERIQNYRDAIQYIHDQSVYHINRGATPEELVDLVKLPDNLANDPWLQEFYGTVAHSVRNVYGGYMGWFHGDATELATPTFKRKAALYVDALGGRDKIIENANAAIERGDYGWAMEITTHLVRATPDDQEARNIKAKAMRNWGYGQANIYWRNFALSGAAELDGSINKAGSWNFANPVIVRQFDTGSILENMRVKINAERALNADLIVGFKIDDQNYAYHVRNGIGVFYDYIPENAAVTLTTDKEAFLALLGQENSLANILNNESIKIEGDNAKVEEFIGYFDFTHDPINLSGR